MQEGSEYYLIYAAGNAEAYAGYQRHYCAGQQGSEYLAGRPHPALLKYGLYIGSRNGVLPTQTETGLAAVITAAVITR